MISPDDAKVSHAKHCDCTPVWKQTDTGQALSCGNDAALIWWPMVDTSQLSDAQAAALLIVAPMVYDDDGDGANYLLLKLGYHQITPDNFDEAKKALRRAYEKLLWEDNVGKQLLMQVFDENGD